jgi:hypothetical protein
MDLESAKDWVTTAGACVAAIAGVWNLAIQMRGRRDRFLVRAGSFFPDGQPGDFMHVISLSDHQVRLADWGFIDDDLKIRSIRVELAYDQWNEHRARILGDPILEKRNDLYEVGYERKNSVIGAFALSVSQTRPRAYFHSSTPLWIQLRMRLKLLYPRCAYGY